MLLIIIAKCMLICIICGVKGQTPHYVGIADSFVLETQTENSGFSCHLGPTRCPDGGQYKNAGGNITLTILEMKNLPNKDGFGAAGLTTDAYIRVTVGADQRTSGTIRNSLNPIWEPCSEIYCSGKEDIKRDLNFGYRKAGTKMTVEVIDEDSGLEFLDDAIVTFNTYVIYCSSFTASVQTTPNPGGDGNWHMPQQPMCVEETWMSTVRDVDCVLADGSILDDPNVPCIKLRQTAIPFQMNVEEVYVEGMTVNGGMAGFYAESMPRPYGRVYSGSDDRLMNYNRFQDASGGLLVRSDSQSNNHKGNTSLLSEFPYVPYCKFTINFDADMFVFRRLLDMEWQPEWLEPAYGWEPSTDFAQLVGVVEDFGAVKKSISAHHRNFYFDSFGAGEVTGMNIHQDNRDITSQMYFIVLNAKESTDATPTVYSKDLDQAKLIASFFQFGIILGLFLAMILKYLKKVNWRLDRVESYLLSYIEHDDEDDEYEPMPVPRSVLRTLFICYNDSENNVEFRRNLFYAKLSCNLCTYLPFLLLFTWGATIVSTVSPPSVGFMLVLVGYAAVFFWYGFKRWKSDGWRMTSLILSLFFLSFLCCFVFLLCSTFVDPKVYLGGEKVDFFSLSAVFLTVNMMPMIYLAFTNDSKIMKSLQQVLAVVTASEKVRNFKKKFKQLGTLGLKLGLAAGGIQRERGEKPKSAFNSLIGDHYSVVSSIPGFEYGDILQNAFVVPEGKRDLYNRRAYAIAMIILLLFSLIAHGATEFPSQGFGMMFTIMVTDAAMAMLLRGNLSWSAGYIVFLMGMFRGCLVVTGGKYWLLGQSMWFMVFGIALCKEIVGKNLPRMSKQEAGGITFFGHDSNFKKNYDISTTPEFVLGFISFFFIFLLLAVVFGTSNPSDFVLLPFFGQEWGLWVFGLVAFILVLFFGVSLGTSRAFFLMKEQLLSEYAANAYLFSQKVKIPFILAAASELLVFCAGLFLYASTGSSFVFITCIFLPLIMMLTMVVYAQWLKNDFQLVIWPPQDEEEEEEDDDEFDEEAEFEKEAEAIRENFVLPALKSEDDDEGAAFKMPALPLKGALLKAKADEGESQSVLKLAGKGDADEEEEGEEADDGSEKEADLEKGEGDGEKETEEVKKTQSKAGKLCGRLRSLMKGKKYLADDELLKNDGNAEEEEEVDFSQMSLFTAFWERYLLPEDYVTIACFFLLLCIIFIYGFVVSLTETPSWFGNIIWLGSYVALFTLAPVVKWFHVLEITQDMRHCAIFSTALAWSGGFILFFQVLKGNVNDVESLIILSFLVMYPIVILLVVTLLKWKDDGWNISDFTRISLPICLAFLSLWIFEMYAWGSIAFGGILTFLLFTFLFALFFLTKWIENEFYVAPKHQRMANRTIQAAMLFFFSLGIFAGEIFYGFSIALIIVILKLAGNIIGKRMTQEPDVQTFFSPYIFPIYSYDPRNNSVVDENYETLCIFKLYGVAFFWGITGILFADPLGFGIGLCSLVLLCAAGTAAHLCSVTPVKMGISAKYVNEGMLAESAELAKKSFDERREKLHLICEEFIEKDRQDRERELQFQQLSMGTTSPTAIDVEDEEEKERRCAGDLAIKIDDQLWKRNFTSFDGKDVRRSYSLFTFKDALFDIWRGGRGPLAYLGFFGYPWALWLKSGKENYNERYDEDGNFTSELPEDEALVDTLSYIKSLPELDKAMDKEFFEETRCIINFQLLVMQTAEARLGRETVLFQKFLRENRFKLMSNGINPPSDIFKTSSFASIDIPLVAVWLVSLTPEERERFHNLKAAFSEEMDRKDAMIDAEDEQTRVAQEEHLERLRQREEIMCKRRFQEFQARRLRRQEEDIELGNRNEAIVNAEEAISEIESGWSCSPGQFGRSLQFTDPDFLPDSSSIAGCSREAEVKDWLVSTGININTGLFDGGTDPDDVHGGKLNDAWFLSAVSILAASDGVDDGKVDALVDNIFITKQTSMTGAYALQFYKNAQWETVIVDDYFPVLDDSFKTEACAGAAFAHSKNFEELWVPLLEKAYAKYHGGYASLEHGYVHHALHDLTGAKSEQFFLAQASRGSNKKKLWKTIQEYQKNKFLMGAGTISSDTADHEILDTGLVFGQCYVIYACRTIGSLKLVKLRNPPGDHAEWRGDWGDDSPLWTRRLKKKLLWTDEDDNTFWMSFDDFCNAFRCLFVCRYYDPDRWLTLSMQGEWHASKATTGGIPTKHNPNCIVENNAQYTLSVLRPTDVVITVTQVDETGLAASTLHPFSIFVVKSATRDRATRVKDLSRDTVEASTGVPARERQLQLFCSLGARSYTVLVAPYTSGMEGLFKIEVQANFKVEFDQMWPPPWREEKVPTTMAEKMAAKVKAKVAESGIQEKVERKKKAYKNKIVAGAQALDQAIKDDSASDEEEEKKPTDDGKKAAKAEALAKKKNAPKKSGWIEQWDEGSGKPFYYNKQTGMSTWEKPDDF